MTVFKKYNGSDWEAIAVGQKGDTGVGVPTGGTTDQVLAKVSATDYDTAWVTLNYVDAAGAVSAIKADADWNATDWDTAYGWGDHAVAGYALSSSLGTIASQDANSVNIDGGAIDATDIGVTTPATVSSDNYLTADNYPTIKPSLNLDFANTKTLDPRVTFARASTATYYDGQTVAKAEENLLTYSQEFNQAGVWTVNSASVNADQQVAPDGTTTADTINFQDAATSRIYQPFSGSGQAFTFSFFAKYIDKQWIAVRLTDSSNTFRFVWFDIQNGLVGTSESGITASITSSAEGFYRCVATIDTTGVSNVAVIEGVNNDNSTVNTGQTGSVYLWGAQLEQRSTVTAYTPTTTQPITNYIPVLQTAASGAPRFDHDPITGESKGLLIEEQRTNLFLRSQEFDDPYWVKGNTSIDSNVVVAPDGTLTGSVFYALSAGTARRLSRDPGSGPNVSIFCKKQPGSGVNELWIYNSANNNKGAGINLTTGVTTSLDANYTASSINVGNGWWRFNVTTQTIFGSVFLILYTDGAINVNVSGPLNGVYIWGAQLEAGSFPTSYIKTEGSQVTRVADSASMTGTNFSDWYRQDEGTLYADISRNMPESQISSGSTGTFSISDNTSQNIIAAWRNLLRVYSSNSLVVNFGLSTSPTYAFAIALKSNDYAISVDGATPSTDSSGVLPSVDRLFIGRSNPIAAFALNGHIKRLAYYPQRLSNLELVALTEE